MNFLSYLKISDELTFTPPKNLENLYKFMLHVYISNMMSLAISNRSNGLAKKSGGNPDHYISTPEQLTYHQTVSLTSKKFKIYLYYIHFHIGITPQSHTFANFFFVPSKSLSTF